MSLTAHSYEQNHLCVCNDPSFMCVQWLIHRCNVTHAYAGRNTLMCVTQLIHAVDMTHVAVCCITFRHNGCVWHNCLEREYYSTHVLQHMCDTTAWNVSTHAIHVLQYVYSHTCVWHKCFKRVTHVLQHMCCNTCIATHVLQHMCCNHIAQWMCVTQLL